MLWMWSDNRILERELSGAKKIKSFEEAKRCRRAQAEIFSYSPWYSGGVFGFGKIQIEIKEVCSNKTGFPEKTREILGSVD